MSDQTIIQMVLQLASSVEPALQLCMFLCVYIVNLFFGKPSGHYFHRCGVNLLGWQTTSTNKRNNQNNFFQLFKQMYTVYLLNQLLTLLKHWFHDG